VRAGEDARLHSAVTKAMATGKPLLSNDPAQDLGGGEPLKSVELPRSLLALPLIRRSEVIAVLALGEREGGYEPFWVTQLEPFGRLCAGALAARRQTIKHRDAEKLIREAIDSIPDGFVIYDQEDRLAVFNPAYAKLYQTSASMIKTGAKFEDLVRWGLERGQYLDAGTTEASREAWIGERMANHRNPPGPVVQKIGDQQWLRVYERITPSGNIVGIRAEVTEVKLMEQELQKINQQLEKANFKLSQFANLAAHDLQEPLRKIHLFSEILEQSLEAGDKEAAEQSFAVIKAGTVRARRLVSDVLTFSRLSHDEPKTERIQLATALHHTLGDLQVTMEEKQAKLEMDEGIEHGWVEADITQLQQLLQNLLSNAMKYMAPNTQPHIALTSHTASDGRLRRLSIADNGIGIDQEHVDSIFEPFRRLHTREEYSGTGIGLAICKATADNHGWRIEVTSAPGKGSTFHVHFEQAEEAAEAL
jgi:signal transduction histidine kinase